MPSINCRRRITVSSRAWMALLVVTSYTAFMAGNAGASDLRTWAFGATIIQINDPEMSFGDVRLGDTVKGSFSYDLDTTADVSGNQVADYWQPDTFQGVRLAIENPRTGDELRYEAPADPALLVTVYSDGSYYDGVSSAVTFSWLANPPRPDLWDLLYMDFTRLDALTNYALPAQWTLDDWDTAAVYFGAGDDPFAVIAQIYSITPISPGDYNFDGKVDDSDYSLWRSTFGPTGYSEADWDRDGEVDAADYVTWRYALGDAGTGSSREPQAVPEPAAAVLLVIGTFAMFTCLVPRLCLETHCPKGSALRSVWIRAAPRSGNPNGIGSFSPGLALSLSKGLPRVRLAEEPSTLKALHHGVRGS